MQPHSDNATDVPAQPPLWRQLQWTARLVMAVRSGHSLAAHIDQVPSELRAGVQALAFHALRHLGQVSAVRDQLVARQPPADTDALLLTVLALMLPNAAARYPVHTVAHQAVEAAKRHRGTRHQAAMINACIRRFARERDDVLAALANDPVARWNYPAWWIERLQADHPDAWQGVLTQAQEPAPMVLRVNRLRGSVSDMLSALTAAGIGATLLGGEAIALDRPMPVGAIPGFMEGRASVQSASAQRAAPLLLAGIESSMAPRVLDACAAPGGKTAQLLELSPRAQVTALEVDPVRTERIVGTLERLGLSADMKVADAANVSEWWDGTPYDRILLDAPCSASGIVRRHPDVRWLRRTTDISQLAKLQDRLLASLWPLLVPGGRLLYATCSVFREEGDDRIEAFLRRHTDARLMPSPGHLLPVPQAKGNATGENVLCDDGFFYALLEKRTT